MFVGKSKDLDHMFTGAEIQPQIDETRRTTFRQGFCCPICGRDVTYSYSSIDEPLEYFIHSDGDPDCFRAESFSDDHRIAVEVAVKTLFNRIKEVTGESAEIDVEKWIGARSNFIIADIRVTSPLQVAAEIFYKSATLALGRRLETMFANDFRTYLIFHTNGRYSADRIEQYLQQLAPLRIGRFDPDSLEVKLGDLFAEHQTELTKTNREALPDYIIR